jgi:hypothetical protein
MNDLNVDPGSLSKEGCKRLPFREAMEKLRLKYIGNKDFSDVLKTLKILSLN